MLVPDHDRVMVEHQCIPACPRNRSYAGCHPVPVLVMLSVPLHRGANRLGEQTSQGHPVLSPGAGIQTYTVLRSYLQFQPLVSTPAHHPQALRLNSS